MEANQNQVDLISLLSEVELNEYMDSMYAEYQARNDYEQGEN